jgi:inosose dehydratase
MAGSPLAAAGLGSSRLSVEVYIWIQYLRDRQKTPAEGLDVIFPMARAAGFRNIELTNVFFTPELRERTLKLLGSNGLKTPSVYVGGGMHERSAADQTITLALDVAGVARRTGCRAIINNPNPKPGKARKSDDELAFQAGALNRLGREIRKFDMQFWVHHHDPEMAEGAREWRYVLEHTDPQYVSLCMDLDWVHQGGQDPLALLREAGPRVAGLHLRNSKQKLWLEALEEGDIDYAAIARYLTEARLRPLLVVELAYRKETVVTRPLEEDLRLSRLYAEKVFHGQI